MARLIDNATSVIAQIEKDVAKRVKAVAMVLKVEHKKHLGTRYPRASQAGEFPRKRTGNLQQDVTAEQVSPTVWRVGYAGQAPYILALKDAGRLAVRESVPLCWPLMQKAAEGK